VKAGDLVRSLDIEDGGAIAVVVDISTVNPGLVNVRFGSYPYASTKHVHTRHVDSLALIGEPS
jgi:hypothetical protein